MVGLFFENPGRVRCGSCENRVTGCSMASVENDYFHSLGARSSYRSRWRPAVSCIPTPRGARIRTEKSVTRATFVTFIGVLWLATGGIGICMAQGQPGGESQRQSALAFEQAGKIAEAEAGWRSL